MDIESIALRYAIPRTYVSPEAEAALAALGYPAKLASVTLGEFTIAALAFDLIESNDVPDVHVICRQVFGERIDHRDLTAYDAGIGKQHILLIVPKRGKVAIDNPPDPNDTLQDKENQTRAFHAYRPMLRRLSRLTGKSVELHMGTSGDVHAPFPEDGAIHIFANARPPGAGEGRWISLAYGLPVQANGKTLVCTTHTRGRGVVRKDGDGQAMVQVLGNNWYLLVPILTFFNQASSRRIFAKLLADGLDAARGPMSPEASLDENAYCLRSEAWIRVSALMFRQQIADIDKRIAMLHTDLAAARRDLLMTTVYVNAYESSDFMTGAVARLPGEYTALTSDPRIARMSVVEDAFHFETTPLFVEHDDVRYAIGTFVIRIERIENTVWGLVPTHKDGIPHPHLPRSGIPCYGNAGLAIAQAVAEFRVVDAVRYILTWLEEGYEAPFALVKITEWPRAGEGS